MQQKFTFQKDHEIVRIREEVREVAREFGFNELDQARIVHSISELARNVVSYADNGVISIESVNKEGKKGLLFLIEDAGPGIPDVLELMKQIKNQRSGELSGLQHVNMLMDNLLIKANDSGTWIEVIKWLSL